MATLLRTDGTQTEIPFAAKTDRSSERIRALLRTESTEWIYLGHGALVIPRAQIGAYNERATIIAASRAGIEGALTGDALLLSPADLREFDRDIQESEHA